MVNVATIKVKAKKVREGDFLPGLDDAYVFQDPDRDLYDGRMNEVVIRFHDAEGEEGFIQCGKNMPISIERK